MIELLAAAAALSLAKPIAIGTWLTDDDYPTAAGRVAERGYIVYRLTVSPAGRVVDCSITQQTTMRKAFCDALTSRGNFTPATDDEGHPAFAVYEGLIPVKVPGMNMPPRPSRAAAVLTVDRLPAGAPDPSDAKLALLVDASGKVAKCEAQPDREQPIDVAMTLGRIACAELTHQPKVAQDEKGEPVSSVQSVLIRFQTPGRAQP